MVDDYEFLKEVDQGAIEGRCTVCEKVAAARYRELHPEDFYASGRIKRRRGLNAYIKQAVPVDVCAMVWGEANSVGEQDCHLLCNMHHEYLVIYFRHQ